MRTVRRKRSASSNLTRVRMISESTFTVRGHGVHSVYEECIRAISDMDDFELVRGLKALGRSVILHSHTVGPVALARVLVHRGPTVMTAHITPSSMTESVRFARPLLNLIRWYMRFVYNRADAVIAVSRATAEELSVLQVHSPTTVVYNAIDERLIRSLQDERAKLKASFGWQGRLTVLAVAQLQPRKGVKDFLECAAALPELRFVWVGGMPFGRLTADRGSIIKDCSSAPSNVTFTGLVARDEVFRYLAAADIFFLPSRQETFGLAALEAAAAGLPLILHNLPCYREWLEGGYLSGANVRDYVSLLRSLEQSELRSAFGNRSASIASRYGREAIIRGLREAYRLAGPEECLQKDL